MKTLIIIFFVVAGLASAQTVADSVKNKEMNREQNQIQLQQEETNRIQERVGSRENPDDGKNLNKPKMDVFIDKDGDGICDNRQSGLSFNKMRNRRGSGTQKGPGGPHGSGSGSGNGSQQQNSYHSGK
ncbi:Hypothetical protein IALB_0260 [Ignavibacterium album JCM 16511]|uniref:Uncharacterized protein n=1 Tax=Ignavibacterium album (strain DSM 19864 / JCM 16511 / NBRC 101810 / Mat9-16) TaxID=945713 RepID=I0AG65_IGNAJ|nr:hypothetical protein [Ignavibacterium album]AFH47972.1 Hypothetical protein IALB_0260 [Ignavibacterium album JCM 16511]